MINPFDYKECSPYKWPEENEVRADTDKVTLRDACGYYTVPVSALEQSGGDLSNVVVTNPQAAQVIEGDIDLVFNGAFRQSIIKPGELTFRSKDDERNFFLFNGGFGAANFAVNIEGIRRTVFFIDDTRDGIITVLRGGIRLFDGYEPDLDIDVVVKKNLDDVSQIVSDNTQAIADNEQAIADNEQAINALEERKTYVASFVQSSDLSTTGEGVSLGSNELPLDSATLDSAAFQHTDGEAEITMLKSGWLRGQGVMAYYSAVAGDNSRAVGLFNTAINGAFNNNLSSKGGYIRGVDSDPRSTQSCLPIYFDVFVNAGDIITHLGGIWKIDDASTNQDFIISGAINESSGFQQTRFSLELTEAES